MTTIDVNELKEPIDITDDLVPENKTQYELAGIKIFAVNLEYLLKNLSKLQNDENPHYYAIFNHFEYYSPINWSYDFSDKESPKLDLGNSDEPAFMNYNNEQILFFVHEELAKIKPSIAYKAYSTNKQIEPVGLNAPIFGINSYPISKLLVPFILMDFEELFLVNKSKLYSKYGNI